MELVAMLRSVQNEFDHFFEPRIHHLKIGETGKLDLIEAVKRIKCGITEDHITSSGHFLVAKRRKARQYRIKVLFILREQRIFLRSKPDPFPTNSQSLTNDAENPKN